MKYEGTLMLFPVPITFQTFQIPEECNINTPLYEQQKDSTIKKKR